MKESRQIIVGKSKINPQVIQNSYNNAKTQGKVYQMLSNTFHILELAQNDIKLHSQQIESIVNSNMLSANLQKPQIKGWLDFNIIYPLVKQGGFGVLERQCQISDKGLLQKQEKKEPTLKQVKGFNNKVEVFGEKTNEKIDWIKDNKQYPFRVILHGDKKQSKALFCKTDQEAENVRVFYANKFNNIGDLTKIIPKSFAKFRQSLFEGFKYRINSAKSNKEQIKLQNSRISQNTHTNGNKIRTENQPAYSTNQPLDKILNRASNPKSQANFPNIYDNMKEDQRLSTQTVPRGNLNFGLFLKLEKLYCHDFFENWNNQAKKIQKIESNRNQSRSVKDKQSQMHLNNSHISQSNWQSKSLFSIKSHKKFYPIISFTKIQFLKMTNTLIKPVISLTAERKNRIEYQCIFTTLIRSKDPHLSYSLILNSGEPNFMLKDDITNYDITIRVVDYLTNQQLSNDRISLKTKVFSYYTLLVNSQKTTRLEMNYDNGKQYQQSDKSMEDQVNPQGNFLQLQPLTEQNLEKIRKYWEDQSNRKGYYNANKDIKVLQILGMIQPEPISWSLGLSEEQYKIVTYLKVASKILDFKLIPSFLSIIHILQKIYSQFEELIEAFLSIVTNYMYSYYYPPHFTTTERLHELIGIEGEIEFSSKIWLQLAILRKIVQIQAPVVEERMNRKNIPFSFLLYQYTYQIYSRVFPTKKLMEIWNFVFKDSANIRIYLILIGAWLMRFYSKKIMRCNRSRQLLDVLQSHQLCGSQVIIKELLFLREKYFGELKQNLIEEIRGYDNKPLQRIAIDFYKRQTALMDHRKQIRQAQKQAVLQKLNRQLQIQLPNYPEKHYCFHIYFYRLPTVPGSLYLKANGIEYECLNYLQNSYFIIGQVGTQVTLQFVNNKSNEFTAKLPLGQGINRFTTELVSENHNQSYKIEYMCGLLTQSHIQALKKNRKFSQYLGPFIKKQEVYEQLLRPVNKSSFLNYNRKLEVEDLGKKIKIIFSLGNKNFEEIQFYLRWISQSSLTLSEKIKLAKQYAETISRQFYLSKNQQLEKMFINEFLKMINFPISALEFQCFYADSINSQFKAAKIIKCRLITPSGKELKLEKSAIDYYISRIQEGLYGDLIISELLDKISQQIESQLSNISEGTISLLYSSYGQVRNISIPVIRKKNSKQLIIDEEKYEERNPKEKHHIEFVEPQILASEFMPNFSKAKTVLDYSNETQNRSPETFKRNQPQNLKNATENLNLLKNCHNKLQRIILMRYFEYPGQLRIPFLNYYHELCFEIKSPEIPKNIYLNNTKSDIKQICCLNADLLYSDNKKNEPIIFKKQLGLFGNLRILPKISSLYFTIFELQEQNNSKIFIDYGYGVFGWEPCTVISYVSQQRNKKNGRKDKKSPKKKYLVRHRQVQLYCRQDQLQIHPKLQKHLPESESGNKQKPNNSFLKSYDDGKSKSSKNIAFSQLLGSHI